MELYIYNPYKCPYKELGVTSFIAGSGAHLVGRESGGFYQQNQIEKTNKFQKKNGKVNMWKYVEHLHNFPY